MAFPSLLQHLDAGSPVNWAHPLNKGRLAWWLAAPLGHPAYRGGGRLLDLCAKYHGTLTNFTSASSGWSGATGRPGGYGSLRFAAASSQYVLEASNSTALQPTNGVTLAIWVNATTWTIYRDICGNSASGWAHGYGIGSGLSDANNIGFWVRAAVGGGYTQGAKVAYSTVPLNVWTHLVGTYDGTTTSFYINGQLVNSVTGGSAASGVLDYLGVSGLYIGKNLATDKYFDGLADDLSLWNRALSAAEVTALYNSSRQGHPYTLRRLGLGSWFPPLSAVGGGGTIAVSVSVTVSWQSRALASVPRACVWQVRQTVALTRQELWTVRTTGTVQRSNLWRVAATVNRVRQAIWRSRGVVVLSRQEPWRVLAQANRSNATLWGVRGLASRQGVELWNNHALATRTQALLWSVQQKAAVTNQVTISWRSRQVITSPLALTWRTRQVLTRLGQEIWRTRALLARSAATVWRDKQLAAVTRTLPWSVQQIGAVFTQRAMRWQTRAVTTRQLVSPWRDRVPVTETLAGLWQNRALASMTRVLPWSVQQKAVVARQALILWRARQTSDQSLDLPWRARLVVTQPVQSLWQVRQQATEQVVSRWLQRALIQRGKSLRWKSRNAALVQQILAWHDHNVVQQDSALSWRQRQWIGKQVSSNWRLYAISMVYYDLTVKVTRTWTADAQIVRTLEIELPLLEKR